uniref:Retrotransposon gag domain-containing protein n=1 Tax=Helianthus annuus TaxID=4232 RepID=A0A251U4U0_HELAN
MRSLPLPKSTRYLFKILIYIFKKLFEETEPVLKISKCAEEDKILFASNLFKNAALEWWNTILQSRGVTEFIIWNGLSLRTWSKENYVLPMKKNKSLISS